MGLLADRGWQVIGVDNNMREAFFGPQGSTAGVVKHLSRRFKSYRHYSTDIRDRQGIRDLMAAEKPDFIIHTQANPPMTGQRLSVMKTSTSTRSAH